MKSIKPHRSGISRPLRRRARASRAFVTGGSRGLGLILTRKLVARGARVVFCARDAREIERAITTVIATCGRRAAGRVSGIACDISKSGQLENALQSAQRTLGGLDLIINNASVIQVGPIESMAPKEFVEALDTNLWPVIRSTLWAQGPNGFGPAGGSIINISSIGGVVPIPHLLPYACSKFGVTGFSLASSLELSRRKIRVLTVVPGVMRTGSFLHALFKGRREAEVRWFTLGATTPGFSINAERAAERILRAHAAGRSLLVLGLPAKGLRLAHALFPRPVLALLRAVNRLLLPTPSHAEGPEKYAKPGALYRTGASKSLLTRLGDRAADRYNQRSA